MLFTQEYLSENAGIVVQGIQNLKYFLGEIPSPGNEYFAIMLTHTPFLVDFHFCMCAPGLCSLKFCCVDTVNL
jgi:hypothetical protein